MSRGAEIIARIRARSGISSGHGAFQFPGMGTRKLAWLGLVVIAGLSIGTSRAQGEALEDPAAVVTGVIGTVEQTLSDTTLSAPDREQKIGGLLREHFDVSAISRFVLGRYSAGASRQEQDTFAGLFQRWMIVTYTGSVRGFSDASWNVVRTRRDGVEGFVVTSEIPQAKSHPIEIEWRLHQDGSQYKIVDVRLEGISLALVEREEVAAVIQQNGGTVAGLNEALERRFGADNGSLALSAGH